MNVYIAIIDHSEGRDVYAAATEADRTRQVFEYVKEWWDPDGPPGPVPEDREQAIREYFDGWIERGESDPESLETLTVELDIGEES